ncbi:putative enoyl-coa hydratase 2, mitochondrial [Fagus crenata]
MENSNPEPEIQVVFDSQVLGSSCSLSLPSEPLDVRNWFSSYEYESPVLDSNDNFGDSVSKESEFVKNELVIEESEGGREESHCGIRKRDEGLAGQKFCSNGSVKCSSFFGDHKLESQSFSKLADSLHSPSLLSEPPDIRNWFSSYVYESPVLGTNDFGDSVCKESEKDDLVVEDTDSEKEDTLEEYRKSRNRGEVIIGEKLHSNGFVKCNSRFVNNEQKGQSSREGDNKLRGNGNPSAQNNLSFEQSLNVKILQNHGVSPTKDASSLNDEGSQRKKEQPQGTHCIPLDISRTSSSDRKSPKQLIYRRGSIEECLDVKVQTEDVECVSPKSNSKLNVVNGSSGKENEGDNISENGFVATRKMGFTRTNNENSLRMPKGINKGTVTSAGGKVGVIKRKVLTETTNFQHSDAMAVTGKWRCPQKSKPNLGPPLKQLRLEQWVRRV